MSTGPLDNGVYVNLAVEAASRDDRSRPAPTEAAWAEHAAVPDLIERIRGEVRWRTEAMAEARLALRHGDVGAAVAILSEDALAAPGGE